MDRDGEPVVAGPDAIARLLIDGGSWWRPLGRSPRLAARSAGWPGPFTDPWSRNRHRLPGGPPPARCPRPSGTSPIRRAPADGRTALVNRELAA